MHIFAGIHKNRPIKSPKGLNTRPTSGRLREALFNICQNHVEGCSFLDLFAGSGAMGLEAISRGAARATFVDNSKESIHCIKSNIQLIKEEDKADVIYGDVFDIIQKLAKLKKQYHIIYADPPYDDKVDKEQNHSSYSLQVLTTIDRQIGTSSSLLSPDGMLFLEDASGTLPENIPLQHLSLKSARSFGRSELHCYIFNK